MTPRKFKIGLALSGGGFRASIFHLGVIRRLEELGIMKDVDVLSTVSGGSIIGAYYACEMERRLRKRRDELEKNPAAIDSIRLEIFEKIASRFFRALRYNMRSRALLFAPIYHPILFAKSLWPGVSRSDIIQKEYDKNLFYGSCLYTGETLSSLPNVTGDDDSPSPYLLGPELVINATSLLSGERVSLSRRTLSGVEELKKINTNVLPLARAVGASACVPGLFPPTQIAGDLLVDGGVSDNQGLDGLLKEGRSKKKTVQRDGLEIEEYEDDYDLIMVSDASGQLAQLDSMSPSARSVIPRTMSILQHEIRNKELRLLIDWKTQANQRLGVDLTKEKPKASFAFVHLHLDIKSRVDSTRRMPSEYIQPLAAIRTDLDQFSMIERESLMYHGYTLIDAQLAKYCTYFLKERGIDPEKIDKLKRPPLFDEEKVKGSSSDGKSKSGLNRNKIKRELVAGAKPMFVIRSMFKFPGRIGVPLVAVWAFFVLAYLNWIHEPLQDYLGGGLAAWILKQIDCLAPATVERFFAWALGAQLYSSVIEAVVVLSTVVIQLFGFFYLLGLVTYHVMRPIMLWMDAARYKALTKVDYSVSWK